jgi:hypothetical protein
MIEQNVPVHLLPEEKPLLMTAEAARIVDLRPWVRSVGAGKITRDHGQGFVLLPELRGDARRDVTIDTGHFAVRRRPPGLEVRLHDVTASAKGGCGAELRGYCDDHEPESDRERSDETDRPGTAMAGLGH